MQKLQLLLMIVIAVLLGVGIVQIGRQADNGAGISFDVLKSSADELVNYGLYEQAIENYHQFAEGSDLNNEKRANLFYLIGNIYMDHLSDYPQAVQSYIIAKNAAPEGKLVGDINRRIISALERMGKSNDAQRMAADASALKPIAKHATMAEDTIVARVGERNITMSELNAEIEKLPDGMRQEFETAEGKLFFLNKYVAAELMYESAKRQGFGDDPEVLGKLADIKRQLMIDQIYQKEVSTKMEISDMDVDLYYRAHKEDFTIPEKVRVRHIQCASEKEANDVLSRVKKGEDFGDLARECSTHEASKAKGGELRPFDASGYIVGLGTSTEFSDAAFAAKVGEVAGPVKTQFGYHVIKVEERMPAVVQDLEAVHDSVVLALQRMKEQELFSRLVERLMKAEDVHIFEEYFTEDQKIDKKE